MFKSWILLIIKVFVIILKIDVYYDNYHVEFYTWLIIQIAELIETSSRFT